MEKIDVLIFGGQSNMQGQSERLSEHASVTDAWEYRYLEDALVPLQNPVGENIRTDRSRGIAHQKGGDGQKWLREHVTGWSAGGNTNLVPEFCRAYIRQTGAKVAAVHGAKGSTQIDYWLPGTVGYDLLTEKTRAAFRKLQPRYQIDRIYFVWLQGESDAIARIDRDTYMESMRCLQSSLQKDLGIHSFGVIRVGRFAGDQRDQQIIDAQDAICREEGFVMLTQLAADMGQQPKYMNPDVKGHYSAEGLELLGRTAGEALGNFKMQKNQT